MVWVKHLPIRWLLRCGCRLVNALGNRAVPSYLGLHRPATILAKKLSRSWPHGKEICRLERAKALADPLADIVSISSGSSAGAANPEARALSRSALVR